MNQGADYMESMNKKDGEYVHQSFDVSMNIFAPVVFIPEDLNDFLNKRCLVVNLGSINMNSQLQKWDKEIDYKVFSKGEGLYDIYTIELVGFSITLTEDMSDYKQWRQNKHVKVIKDVTIGLKAS